MCAGWLHTRKLNRMLFFDFFRGDRPPLIAQSLKDMGVMLETGQHMFEDAAATLLDNEVLESNLSEQDQVVNRKEAEIRRAVLEHVSIDPKREMIFSLVLISIVQDAERIGDLAKSIAEVAQLASGPRHGARVETLRDLRDRLLQTFKETREAFADADEELAKRVMDDSYAVKHALTEFVTTVARDEGLASNAAVILAIGARMMSRISSHLSNIASSVALPFDQIRRPPGWE